MFNLFSLGYSALLLTTATTAARIGVTEAPGIPWFRIVVALLFCLIIAAGSIFAIRTYQSRGMPIGILSKLAQVAPAREIDIIETRRASEHGQLCLFHCRGSSYLVVITAGGATLIDKQSLLDDDKGAA